MPHVHGEITINRPVEEVFDFVADQRNEPQYNAEMVESELISDGPIGAGSRFHAVLSQRGRPIDMTIEFTRFERPRLIEEVTHLSNMEIEGSLSFEPVPSGTRTRWLWDVHPHGFVWLMGPLVTRMGRRQEERIWTGLKQLVEKQQAG